MSSTPFSLERILAMMAKEFVQMRRDRMTLGMMIGVPIMQLTLFGYAINNDPKHLPTMVEVNDSGPLTRAVIRSMEVSDYFRIIGEADDAEDATEALRSGKATFVVTIPKNFERDAARGDRPRVLLDADASDPAAASRPVAAFPVIISNAAARELDGSLASTLPQPGAVDAAIHRRFNPEGVTAINIVPGLLGVILTMTMVLMTALAITREAERGTLETLLASPAKPMEVMIGKIMPFITVGAMQTTIMLLAAFFIFAVPFTGEPLTFMLGVTLFMFVNLSLGFLFSTVATTQIQAMQLTFFFFLPQIMLSGFMFPFRGMPGWAQAIGECLPLTHFMRVNRAVMLKHAGIVDVWPDLVALLTILVVIGGLAMLRYRRTLD